MIDWEINHHLNRIFKANNHLIMKSINTVVAKKIINHIWDSIVTNLYSSKINLKDPK